MKQKSVLGMMMICSAITAAAAIVACSSDTPAPAVVADAGGVTTVHIKASEGGTVSDPGGTAKLTIPAGSLEKDTDITLKLSAAGGQALTQVYEFGPDGTKFTKPATLEIKADAKLAPAGKTLAVGMGAGSTFTALEGSAYANGQATAPVPHFTSFTVIFVDGTAVIVPPATCTAAAARFKPCGGDPKGTWTFADFCLPAGAIGSDPFQGRCPTSSVTADITIDREVTIDATTITLAAGSQTSTAHFILPLMCVNQLPDGGAYDSGINDCAALQANYFKNKDGGAPTGVCTDNGAGVCDCTNSQTEQKPADAPSTYTINGNIFTTTDAQGKVTTSEFCVEGDIITSRETGTDAGAGSLRPQAQEVISRQSGSESILERERSEDRLDVFGHVGAGKVAQLASAGAHEYGAGGRALPYS